MKIILNIDNKEVNLTLEEARRIYNELDRVFGCEKSVPFPPWNPDDFPFIDHKKLPGIWEDHIKD